MIWNTGEPESTYQRFLHDAAQVIRSSARTRALVRTTRLRIRLREIANAARRARPSRELLEEVLAAVMRAADAPMGNVQLWDGDSLQIRVHQGFRAPFLEFFGRLAGGKCACASALSVHRQIIVDQVERSPVFTAAPRAAVLEAGVRAVQSLPLYLCRRPLGVISVHYSAPGSASANQAPLASMAREIAETVGLCARI